MEYIKYNEDFDQSNLEKILANVKKEFEKSGKQFNDVFKSFRMGVILYY